MQPDFLNAVRAAIRANSNGYRRWGDIGWPFRRFSKNLQACARRRVGVIEIPPVIGSGRTEPGPQTDINGPAVYGQTGHRAQKAGACRLAVNVRAAKARPDVEPIFQSPIPAAP